LRVEVGSSRLSSLVAKAKKGHCAQGVLQAPHHGRYTRNQDRSPSVMLGLEAMDISRKIEWREGSGWAFEVTLPQQDCKSLATETSRSIREKEDSPRRETPRKEGQRSTVDSWTGDSNGRCYKHSSRSIICTHANSFLSCAANQIVSFHGFAAHPSHDDIASYASLKYHFSRTYSLVATARGAQPQGLVGEELAGHGKACCEDGEAEHFC
jgi:hypothetical protein